LGGLGKMKYKVEMFKTYRTYLEVEADSPSQAEAIFDEVKYELELEQCDVEEEIVTIKPLEEK
jgi:hypothetical protein